jgi:hypothetical protein
MPIAKQRVAKYIPAEANTRKDRRSIARQRRGKWALSTIQAVFRGVRANNVIREASSEAGSSVVVEERE